MNLSGKQACNYGHSSLALCLSALWVRGGDAQVKKALSRVGCCTRRTDGGEGAFVCLFAAQHTRRERSERRIPDSEGGSFVRWPPRERAASRQLTRLSLSRAAADWILGRDATGLQSERERGGQPATDQQRQQHDLSACSARGAYLTPR